MTNDRKIRVVSEGTDQFVDHQAKDDHLGGTSVVELNGTLLQLGFLIKVIPAKVDVSITEVTGELRKSGDFAHKGALEDTNEGDDLDDSSRGDVVGSEDGRNTVGVGVEAVSSIVDVTRKVDPAEKEPSKCENGGDKIVSDNKRW